MGPRLLLNLFLLAIATGLALFLFYTDKEEPVPVMLPLTTLKADDITDIHIIRRNLDDIVFKKENGRWQLTEPLQYLASDYRIKTLLNFLETKSINRFNIADVELSRFLLDTPLVSIRFNETKIDFGDTNPLDKTRYVFVNNAVHLVNDSIYQQLMTNATFFLDTRLITGNSKIKAIRLSDYRIQNIDDKWTIQPEINISAEKIISTVTAWQNVTAVTIREYETMESKGSVQIDLENGKSIIFQLIGDADNYIFARPDIGLQYHMSHFDMEKLFPKPGQVETDTDQSQSFDH